MSNKWQPSIDDRWIVMGARRHLLKSTGSTSFQPGMRCLFLESRAIVPEPASSETWAVTSGGDEGRQSASLVCAKVEPLSTLSPTNTDRDWLYQFADQQWPARLARCMGRELELSYRAAWDTGHLSKSDAPVPEDCHTWPKEAWLTCGLCGISSKSRRSSTQFSGTRPWAADRSGWWPMFLFANFEISRSVFSRTQLIDEDNGHN